MAGRELNAKEVLNDVVAGVDDATLREKYKLTQQGLKNLYEALAAKGLLERRNTGYVIPTRSISATRISRDILWGMTGFQIMKKYRLTPATLQTILKKLVGAGTVDMDELGLELYLRLEAAAPDNIRQVERVYLDFDVTVFDKARPCSPGLLRDVSEKGVGLKGIPARIGEIKTLMIVGDALGQLTSFEFEAKCRWTTADEEHGELLSGFEITLIQPRALNQLKKLVKLATL